MTFTTLRRPRVRFSSEFAETVLRSNAPGEPKPRQAPGRATLALALSLVLGVFALRCFHVACTDSITSDESTYLIHSLHYWMTGDDLGCSSSFPRLPHVLNALPCYLTLKYEGRLPDPALTRRRRRSKNWYCRNRRIIL